MGKSKPGLRDLISIKKPWSEYRIVWSEPEGQYDMVAIETQWDYGLEGYFLAHCLGTKDYEEFSETHIAYSLRDSLRIPHATILCVRDGARSMYGGCTDLGTTRSFTPEEGVSCRVVQVRGRQDTLAAMPYHRIVRSWFVAHGGALIMSPDTLDYWCESPRLADHDWQYHCEYLLDESVNFFNWAHHNEEARRAYTPR